METNELNVVLVNEKSIAIHDGEEKFIKIFKLNDDEFIFTRSSLKVENLTPVINSDEVTVMTQYELNEELTSLGVIDAPLDDLDVF